MTEIKRAVAFDFDDTLLHDDLTVSDETVRVFRALRDKGFRIIAASGRSLFSMQPFVKRLGCVDYIVSCNGAEIWDGRTEELIHRDLFAPELAREIITFAEEKDCYAHLYEGEYFCYNREGETARRYAAASRLTGKYIPDLRSYIHEPRNKILMIDDPKKIAEMLTEARARFDGRASVTCSKPKYLEFNPPGANKGQALKVLSGITGVPLENMTAFGDSLNDLSMLRTAGTGVSVSNGWKEILPFCDAVCESNNEDGPARFMAERYLKEDEVTA